VVAPGMLHAPNPKPVFKLKRVPTCGDPGTQGAQGAQGAQGTQGTQGTQETPKTPNYNRRETQESCVPTDDA